MASCTSRGQDGHHVLDAPHNIEVARVRTATTTRIVVNGEIDIATAPWLLHELESARDYDTQRIILDLEAVTFIDSSGLHALIHAHDQLAGRLRIIPSPIVTRLVHVACLNDRLPIIDPRDLHAA